MLHCQLLVSDACLSIRDYKHHRELKRTFTIKVATMNYRWGISVESYADLDHSAVAATMNF